MGGGEAPGATTTTASAATTGPGSSSTTSGPGSSTTTSTGGSTAHGGGGSTSQGGGSTAEGGQGGGVGGAGGSGTGGGFSGDETCPGELITVVNGTTVVLHGTVAGAADDYASEDACSDADPDGGDVVFQLDLVEDATVRITLSDGLFLEGNLLFGASCGEEGFVRCYPAGTFGEVKVATQGLAAGTYFVMVDSLGGLEGDFELSIEADDPACGDGVLNAGEDCDPGGPHPEDGCVDPGAADACRFEAAPSSFDDCPGEPIALDVGTTTLLASDGFSTYGYVDDHQPQASGSCGTPGSGADRVLAVTPAASGTMTVTVGLDPTGTDILCREDADQPGCWDHVLYARATCDEAATQLDCDQRIPMESTPEQLSFGVEAGVPVFVFVDGHVDPNAGPFNLVLELTP